MHKGVFWSVSWFFGVFFSQCFVLLFCKEARKGYFLANLEVFYCSPKRPVFRILLFFLLCFLIWFSFFHPFQNSIFSLVFLHQPLFGKHLYFGFLLFFFFLPFHFLMFACFFETNFPNIPFWRPTLLSFWVVYFFSCFCFCFHGVCFCLFVSMLVLFMVIFLFSLLFFSCFLFCFQSMKNIVLPAILVFLLS